jgi:hypothetical protein
MPEVSPPQHPKPDSKAQAVPEKGVLMLGSRCHLLLVILCPLIGFFCVLPAHAEDWPPVTPDELKMTAYTKAPGAPAIYLFRQVDRDDTTPKEHVYARIKILNEEGRKYADVEIPFVKEREKIYGIQARTIRPDGSIAPFDGKVYEKMIVKSKGIRYLAKTFTLTDVQVGSIIEYRYWNDMQEGYVFDSHWILSEELFTRHAKFSLKPYTEYALRWSWPVGLPQGTNPPKQESDKDKKVLLETNDVPAFEQEDYMPPENELKYRVDFVYITDPNPEKDPDKFWQQFGKKKNGAVEGFVNKRKAMDEAVAQIVSPTDSPEVKLQKIYARCQLVRNLSYERDQTEQERKRDDLKSINNVEDIWKRGYASGYDITWLFLGLARATGLQANPVLVSTRTLYFFSKGLMNTGQLNSNVVVVNLNGKDIYFDPGAKFTPYGMLPWIETGVQGLRLDKEGGTWVRTSMPEGTESRIERKAVMQMSDTGDLEGTVTVTFTGLEAQRHRQEYNNEDDAARKKFLEDQLREYIPVAIDVELTNKPDWNGSTPLIAEYKVKVTGWASAAGHRVLVSTGLFGGAEKHLFEHTSRVYPIYFSFPYQDKDDVTITLPSGWQTTNVPPVQDVDAKLCLYHEEVKNESGSLHINRQLTVNVLILETKYYAALRNFYQMVRKGDEQQIVLSANAISAQN